MSVLKKLATTAAVTLTAGTLNAATLTFDIEAEVTHITNNVTADVEKGDTIRVTGAFDTASRLATNIPNRMNFADKFDIEVSGPIFGGFNDYSFTLLEFRDDEAGIDTDLMRLVIDFNTGPVANDADYDRVRLSFYIPMALDTLDIPSFLALNDTLTPSIVDTATGRGAAMSGAFRFPTTPGATAAGFRGNVTSVTLAPVPLPAGGTLLLTLTLGAGILARRRRT